MPRVAARAIVLHEGRVLFLRGEEPGRVYYFLPGGHVRHGESLAQAVRREVEEETGIRVIVERALYAREFIASRHKRRSQAVPEAHHVLAVVFLCRPEYGFEGEFKGDESVSGVTGMEWLPLTDLAGREIHPPHLKRALMAPFPPTGSMVEFWGEER